MIKIVMNYLSNTRNVVPFLIILLLFYEYLFQKLDTSVTKCVENISSNSGSGELPSVSINLHRIKKYYSKKGDFFIPSSFKQKDWHDYTKIALDRERQGIGEHGKPASMPSEDQEYEKNLLLKYGYNAGLSEKIALERALPDVRHPACRKRMYLESLPTVSVIVPFHNEHYSVILRTVVSATNRSPENLLKEIFLIDDASDADFPKEYLDTFLKENIPKAKVIRLANRSGIVTARLAGAKASTADVLVFLDAHTEANVNWLPPLLEPIALDYQTAVVPIIDPVAYKTLKYIELDGGARGSFDWTFTYMRLPLPPKDVEKLPEPFETPIMLGGLFAISRKFFWELGGYDPGLRGWGGDQYELSFKIWQCHGRMLEAPCSRFGHLYRVFDMPDKDDFTARNFRRIGDVWMDEYAAYLYERRTLAKDVDPGDLTDQKALRERLKCKPFKWFMTQIAYDLTQQFPPVQPLPYAEGRIRPKINPHLCVDAHNGKWNDVITLKPCHKSKLKHLKNTDEQEFVLTWYNDVMLKSRNTCWDVQVSRPGSHVQLHHCHHSGATQHWRYYEDTKRLVSIGYTYSMCLDHNPRNNDLFISLCDDKYDTQLWEIDIIHKDQMAKWNVLHGLRVTGPVESWEDH